MSSRHALIEVAPAPRNERARRRKQLARALRNGLWVQAIATLVGLLILNTLLGGYRHQLAGNLLFIVGLLVPAAAGGFVSGSRAPHLRWWHVATTGLLSALLFLLLTGTPVEKGGLIPTFRYWLALNLVLCPPIGAVLGQWGSFRGSRRPREEPRPRNYRISSPQARQ